MADSARNLVRAAWKEARKASIALRLLLFTTQARPQSLKMASTSDNSSDSNAIPLTENDISGASLLGRKPEELKNSELKFWLKCRGDTGKGLKTKADPHKIYSRRKQKQGTSSELVKESTAAAEFPTTGWGTSLEKMPMFTRLQMNHQVLKSGKTIGNIDHDARQRWSQMNQFFAIPLTLIKVVVKCAGNFDFTFDARQRWSQKCSQLWSHLWY